MNIKRNAFLESEGFHKLSWLERIGFGSGDLAQNLIYQTICVYLLFFYTDVYGISALDAATMFLVVRLVDVLWDPLVGTFVDKHNPRWGKYRSYLVMAGIPLTCMAILCFWDGLAEASYAVKLFYAYITYVGLSMLYTLINVPYGALNSSLTRDTEEITILTSVRMVMANIGGLAVNSGLPLLIAIIAPAVVGGASGADKTLPKDPNAWLWTMTIYAIVGLLLLFFCFSQSKERVTMDKKDVGKVKVSDLWQEFSHNRPLRIIAFFFITAFAMMSIGNAAGAYYMKGLGASPLELSLFMALGSLPGLIVMPFVPWIKGKVGKKPMFYIFLSVAVVGMLMLYLFSIIEPLKEMWLIDTAQFIKSTGVIIATGYMWALVPEVISFGEWKTGKRIAGIVNALTGIFFKAGMALGGVVPGLVLAIVGYDKEAAVPTALAWQGILWLVALIPAVLLVLAMFIISKYELEDDVIDKINKEIEMRRAASKG